MCKPSNLDGHQTTISNAPLLQPPSQSSTYVPSSTIFCSANLNPVPPPAPTDRPQNTFGRRPKLWELEPELHCSVIGTCLALAELQKIYRRIRGSTAESLDDHALHALFVSNASEPSAGIRLLHKQLERIHRSAVQRFSRAKTESELTALWQQALDSGDVAGSYWALLTHADVTPALVTQAFNKVHMLSHLAGRNWQAEKRRRQALEHECHALRQRLADHSARLQQLQAAQDQHAQEIARYQSRLRAEAELNAQLRQSLADSAPQPVVNAGTAPPERQLPGTNDSNLRDQLTARINQVNALHQQLADRQHECEALSNRLAQLLDLEDEERRNNSVSANLDGRHILYVGGRGRAQARFRNLVERLNGCYLHHDGGRQDSHKRLPALLAQADAVLCPLDCVSHGAVDKIKHQCKRQNKPMLLLRSASLAAFNTALNHIPTDAANDGNTLILQI